MVYVMGTSVFFNRKSLTGISSYPIALESTVSKLFSNEKLQRILQVVERQVGKIKIEVTNCNGNKALWSWKEKTIKLDTSLLNGSAENQLAYLVFELFNALQTSEFKRLVEETSDVEELVLNVEILEHKSALKTKEIIPQIVGESAEFAFKYIDPEFKYHYALDQISGHAEWLARSYFPAQSYRGNLFHPIASLDKKARELLYALLYYKMRKTPIPKKDKSSQDINFDKIMSALKENSPFDTTTRKVLDCANHLFL